MHPVQLQGAWKARLHLLYGKVIGFSLGVGGAVRCKAAGWGSSGHVNIGRHSLHPNSYCHSTVLLVEMLQEYSTAAIISAFDSP